MQNFTLFPYQPGDVITMRKPHPCGSKQWRVDKAGAEITIVCCLCGHRHQMKRRDLEKATRAVNHSTEETKGQIT